MRWRYFLGMARTGPHFITGGQAETCADGNKLPPASHLTHAPAANTVGMPTFLCAGSNSVPIGLFLVVLGQRWLAEHPKLILVIQGIYSNLYLTKPCNCAAQNHNITLDFASMATGDMPSSPTSSYLPLPLTSFS